MTKLFKYLKQSWVAILTILILLALQATTELSLPTYTSNIVNVGIQQSGIENATIKAIRESEMNKLTTFMNDSDKEKVLDNYKLVNKDNLSKEEFAEMFRENHLTIVTIDCTEIPVSLSAWLALTNTPAEISENISKRFANKITGSYLTGFHPYQKDGEIYFNQRWVMMIGEKNINGN